MTPRLLIIGAGSQARYVIETVRAGNSRLIIGLIDTFENRDYWGRRIDGVEVLGGSIALEAIEPAADLGVVLAIANATRKEEFADRLTTRGHQFVSIVHPRAVLASDVTIGAGTIINAGAVIERGSRIGTHVIIHAGCVIEHDNVIEDFANIAPGVVTAGRVVIGKGATVYTGARIIPDVVVGARAIVGAGAVVIRSVAPETTVVGVPAHDISKRS
jgi:sugar O-acyltransferase (sialic acid O-acetyltransferase NeuD family)